ncbi:MAG: helix-turn-helix domain-containing protein [Treponema sp.]|jgi:hypothetical protein|nr:helix-turn-helix domain-containing protein [Treponema sp.]
MKISAEILYKNLKSYYSFTVTGNVGSEPDFERPLFFRDGKDCRDGHIYIAQEEMISSLPEAKTGSVLLYIGEKPELLSPFFEASFFFRDISVFDLYNVVEKIRSLYDEWDRDLRDIMGGNRDIQQMLDRSLPVFNNPLVVYDQNLSTLAYSKAYDDDMPVVSLMEKKKLAGYGNMTDFNENYLKQKAAFVSPCTAGVRSLYINISRQGRTKCRLMLLEVSRKLDPSDTPLLEHLANIIQSALAESFDNDMDTAAALSYVLKNILTGEYRDLPFIEQRLGEYGWKKEQSFACLKISADMRESGNLTLHAIGDRLKERLSGASIFEYEGSLAVFLNLSLVGEDRDKVIAPLVFLLEEENLRAGMGSCFTGFDELHQYYKQAELALTLGSRYRPDQRLCHFRDMLELQLLDSCTRELPAHMVCAPELIRLREYDSGHNTNYFHTLYVFLKNNLRPVQTIKELYIHRSTLIYRLERIRKITGLDVERCNNQWFLLLSFKLLENEECTP